MSTQTLDEFRAELRTWIAANVTDDIRADRIAALPEEQRVPKLRRWQKTLADSRWIGITWPSEYGGRDAGIPEQIAYVEEMTKAGAPDVPGTLGIGIVGPPILAFGTDEQKQRFARRILNGDDIWCCGFSEPGAGSDLASLRTTAIVDGDELVVNGQKVWTSYAHLADWCMVFARTDPNASRRKGVSCLLIDMKSPGITVRPLRQIGGQAEFNEVFFEDVRVPRANLLGELHNGWSIVTAALQNERGILYVVEMQILLTKGRDMLMQLARESGAANNPITRQALAEVYLGVETFRHTCQRVLDKLLRMGMPGPEASIIKLHWTELTQSMPKVGMSILGAKGLLFDTPSEHREVNQVDQWVQRTYLMAPAASIASGTTEIMKGIVAMQVLGLPRGS
jgi:alkylation response protein AidB-like acyl-CoA dehydrogenase